MNVDISAWGDNPPLWIVLLADEVKRLGQIQLAAERVGVNRATVSTCLRNCYPSKSTDRIERKVLAKLASGRLACPLDGESITPEQCQKERKTHAAAPTHNPFAMQRWATCQRCRNNPARQE